MAPGVQCVMTTGMTRLHRWSVISSTLQSKARTERNNSRKDKMAQTGHHSKLICVLEHLDHKTCINTAGQVLEKTLFAINAIFSKDK